MTICGTGSIVFISKVDIGVAASESPLLDSTLNLET
jgi:hypothetical protein